MSKEDLDLIEFALIVYIAIFVTIIGFRQINQNESQSDSNINQRFNKDDE